MLPMLLDWTIIYTSNVMALDQCYTEVLDNYYAIHYHHNLRSVLNW